MLIIIATILTLTTPTGRLSPNACLIYLGMFRILLGVGVGGDYPMSASVTSDRSNLYKRGTMLAYIFSNQGWGSFVGSLATIIVLLCYKSAMEGRGETSKVDGGVFLVFVFSQFDLILRLVWRVIVGLSLIPAFGTLYQRLTLPESTRYISAQKVKDSDHANEAGDDIDQLNKEKEPKDAKIQNSAQNQANVTERRIDIGKLSDDAGEVDNATAPPELLVKKKAHFGGTFCALI
jgi:PHS family inorganic phosphate transporter-like MFS transporter